MDEFTIQTMEYYSALKRNELSRSEKTWRKLKWILESKRSQYKKAAYCDSNYLTFWKRHNYGDNKKISGCRGLEGEERWRGRMQGIFRTKKSLWYYNQGHMSL